MAQTACGHHGHEEGSVGSRRISASRRHQILVLGCFCAAASACKVHEGYGRHDPAHVLRKMLPQVSDSCGVRNSV